KSEENMFQIPSDFLQIFLAGYLGENVGHLNVTSLLSAREGRII
ncbi:hypothetical protein AVEN_239338-2-1, partial [Araneus ventricosus]